MATGLGLVFGIVLFAALFEGFSRISSLVAAAPMRAMSTADGIVRRVMGRGVSRIAYQATPWFHEFRGRAVNMRAVLVPFSDIDCDSQSAPGEAAGCSGGRQNSHGFRVPEYTIAHPPETFRVVIVGDSFTWGDGVDVEEVYHQQLQKRLDATHLRGRPPIEVIALGVSGSSIWDNVTRLVVQGSHLRPDLVLVQFFENDLDYRGFQALLRDLQEDHLDHLLKWTSFGRTLRSRRRESLLKEEMAQRYDPESLEWRLFEDSLKVLARWKQSREVPVAFLSFPFVDLDPEGRNFGGYEHWSSPLRFQQQAERAIEKEGFPLLRILDAFRARAGDRYLAVSRRNGHYNRLANELASDAVFDFLTTADWVDLERVPRGAADERWAAEQALRRRAQESWNEFYRSYELQRELFEQLVELFPENAWLTRSLAFVLRELGDIERSRALYLQLAELEPLHAAPWYDLAEGTRDPTEMEALLVRMLVEVPDHVAAVEKLADLDVAAGRIGRACGCYSRVTNLSNYPGQFSRGLEAFRRHECDTVPTEPCPGRDPVRNFPEPSSRLRKNTSDALSDRMM